MIDRELDRLGKFQTTSWSLIIAAGQQPTTSAEAALVELCQLYWYPVYVFIRRRGYSKDDASDLTQEFFARLLEKNYLKEADPVRGRFRSFLLVCVSHFLSNEWNRERAQKRGGGSLPVALDAIAAECRYSLEPASQETPEDYTNGSTLFRFSIRYRRPCAGSTHRTISSIGSKNWLHFSRRAIPCSTQKSHANGISPKDP